MAQYAVIHTPSSSAPESAWSIRRVNVNPQEGETLKEAGIRAIQTAFGEETTGIFYFAPISAFGKLTATAEVSVTYT